MTMASGRVAEIPLGKVLVVAKLALGSSWK